MDYNANEQHSQPKGVPQVSENKEDKEQSGSEQKKPELGNASQASEDQGDDPFVDLSNALRERDFAKAEVAYKTLQEHTKDDKSREEHEFIYRYELFTLGDLSAMQRLKDLAEHTTSTSKSSAYFWIASAYNKTNDYAKAFQYYKLAAESSKEDVDKALYYLAKAAKSQHSAGHITEAYELLEHQISLSTNGASKAALYKGLADLCEKDENSFLRALATEKAIAAESNNGGLMFDAGFAYSAASFHDLSILHYCNLIALNQKADWAFNNLGVEYSNENLEISSIQAYKKASELGNTLAMSNIAYKYIQVGFEEEARKTLKRANEQQQVHENVAHAQSRLASDRKQEEEAKQAIMARAKVAQKFFREFAEAYFAKASIPAIKGSWHIPTFGVVVLENNGKELKADWQSGDNQFALLATLHNKAAIGSIRKTPKTTYYSPSSTETFYTYFPEKLDVIPMLMNNKVVTIKKAPDESLD
jgi:tetratricopeptide (TPR) repeat protein